MPQSRQNALRSGFKLIFAPYLLVAEPVKLQNIVSQAHQRPLAAHFFNASQQKLTESARLLDLSEHGFDDRLARRINGFPGFGL